MKFIVSTSELLKQLLNINGVVGSNTVLPILEDFLFEVTPGNLTVSATDLETSMITQLDIESKESGKIAVPAKILIETLRTLPEQPITFSFDEKTFAIEISSDTGKYKLVGENAEDFPKIALVEEPSALEIHAHILEKAISKTVFAVSTDTSARQSLTGVNFDLKPENIIMVATDAHRLVKYERTDSTFEADATFVVPRKALLLLKNVLSGFDGNIRLEYNKTNAWFTIGGVSLICRLIDDRFPKYQAIIPVSNENELFINRLDLLNCLKRIVIYSNESTRQVRFAITGSQVKVSGEDVDYSSEANERLACQYNGEDMDIGFNAKFLIEMLSHLESRDVVMMLSDPSKAGILRQPEAERDPNEDVMMLVMPVQVK